MNRPSEKIDKFCIFWINKTKIFKMIGDGAYEPLSRENGHKIARWFTPKSKSFVFSEWNIFDFIQYDPYYMGIWV